VAARDNVFKEELVDIVVKQGNIAQEAAELIVVNLFQGVTLPGGATGAVDGALGGMIREVLSTGDFTGKSGETILLYTRGVIPAPRVLIVGLGDSGKLDLRAVRNASATVARKARELGVKHFATIVHGAGIGGLDPQRAAQAVAEGALLGLYRFEGYRSKPPKDWKPDPEKMTVVEFSFERRAALEAGIRRGESIAKGVNLARQLVNTPANHMTPSMMAETAETLARETGLDFDALGRNECKALGMGIFMAVAEESEQEPRLIVLEHNKGVPGLPTVVLVGKGVTFDSGGISLKPGEDMWRMKGDMAGAAAVIGALGIAARLNLPVHVVGLAPCAENLPGGRAQKPGDVFTGMNGKTMEVISTDAEGRMLLADALAYAARFKPAAVIDIATLTGVQSMALGPQAAGFFANDETLASRLTAAAEASGERVWRFPLYDEYLETIRSQVADVKNTGGRYGGLGTSAKFIEHFTEGYPWAHVDMASMSMSEDDKPAKPKGATGYGVRLFTALLEGWPK
jgi:leucyl aminopeptidase